MIQVGNNDVHPLMASPYLPAFGTVASVRGYGRGSLYLEPGRTTVAYLGYGQPPEGEGPEETEITAEDVAAATQAAELAAEEAEKQYLIAQQQISFNTQLIAGFVASAAFGIVATALGAALMQGKKLATK